VDLLTRKERPVLVSVTNLSLLIDQWRLLDGQICGEIAALVYSEPMYVARTNDIGGFTRHAGVGHHVGVVEPCEQVLPEPPRENGVERLIRKVLGPEPNYGHPTSVRSGDERTRMAEQRPEVPGGGFKRTLRQPLNLCPSQVGVHAFLIGASEPAFMHFATPSPAR
jgi:hypothetical protein